MDGWLKHTAYEEPNWGSLLNPILKEKPNGKFSKLALNEHSFIFRDMAHVKNLYLNIKTWLCIHLSLTRMQEKAVEKVSEIIN